MLIRAVLLLLITGFVPVQGATVKDLYQTQVPVADQQEAARNKAASAGMADVLVKVSGSRTVLRNEEIQRAMQSGSRYLSRFSYNKNPEPVTTEEGEELAYLVELLYRKNAIMDLLTISNEPIWAESRPATLIWMVVDDLENGRRLPLADDLSDIRQITEEQAVRRGLPVIWPIYDLQEQSALTLDQLWQADNQAVLGASMRYEADGVLQGRLLGASDGVWRTAWEYSFGDSTTYWDSECEELADCVAVPIDAVAEILAARYALISTDDGNQVTLQVDGLDSFDDYGDVLFYFKKLIAVSNVELASVKGTSFTFVLRLNTDQEKLQELIGLNDRLAPLQDSAVASGNLYYQWN